MKTGLVYSLVLIFAACAPALSAQSSPSPKTTAASSARLFEAAGVSLPLFLQRSLNMVSGTYLRLKAKLRYTTLMCSPRRAKNLGFIPAVTRNSGL